MSLGFQYIISKYVLQSQEYPSTTSMEKDQISRYLDMIDPGRK